MVSEFVAKSDIVGMAGMYYLGEYDKYNVSPEELEELKKRSTEAEARREESTRLQEETEALQEQN